MPEWFTALLAIAGGITTLSAALVALRKVGPALRRVMAFINDVTGEPARPGVEARPGLVESVSLLRADVAHIKETQETQGRELEAVKHELHPNSGGSLRDAVDRLQEAAGITNKPSSTPTTAAAAA